MRKSGFYFVILEKEKGWEIARWDSELNEWTFIESLFYLRDKELIEIDERQIVRATEKEQHIFPNPELIELKGVNDLTKPMGHDMNPLQRNYMDSTH